MSSKDSIENEKRVEAVEVASAFGGEDNLPPPPTLSDAEQKKIWRKIDMVRTHLTLLVSAMWADTNYQRMLPILSLMYLCAFLDRGRLVFIFILKPILTIRQEILVMRRDLGMEIEANL